MASRRDSLQKILAAGQVKYVEARDVRPAGVTFDLDGGGTVQVVGDEQTVAAMEFGTLIKLAAQLIAIVGDIFDGDGGDKPDDSGDGSGGGSGSGGGGKTIIIQGGNNTIIIN